MKRRALAGWLMGAAVFSAAALAAPLERDLGQGLKLYRVHELPADLPPAAPASGRVPPCVVDLRYAKADADAATALQAWLRFRAKPRVPVFVLANADTSAALLRVLKEREAGGGIAVIGIPGRALKPDVAVRTTAEEERKAYDALENGATIAALLTDNPDKVRNDEASLSRDRLAEASAETATDAGAPKHDAVVDVALQRAVHLHRTLVALRKL